jgi:tRNA threonylcarbamoyl adenosine modification protein YeaZ
MLLAIDSSLGTSVAVVSEAGDILAEQHSTDRRAHAETIGVLIQGALREANVNPAAISAVVMGVGPGPYTGLRVGMAAASAFALSRDLKLLPVVSHDASGWFHGADCVVVTDARRGEVAYSVYRAHQTMVRVAGPALATPEKLDQELQGFGALPKLYPETISAGQLARVALAFTERQLEFPSVAPVYLRLPDVTVKS